jgi:HAD superfamily hydrolase (TIGR01509 family)
MLKALLFDLDGTLTETDSLHFQTWHDVLLEYGLEIDRSAYQEQFSGRLNAAIIKDLLPHLSDAEGKVVSDRKEAEFRQRAGQQLQPLAGLMDFLAWADTYHLGQAVVTNAPRENAWFMLRALDLSDRFHPVVLAEDLERGKPDPLPYQTALDQLSIPAHAAVAFEDSPSGVRSAVAAGITTIGIASTHTIAALQAAGATTVVSDFGQPELKALMQSAFSQVLSTPVS